MSELQGTTGIIKASHFSSEETQKPGMTCLGEGHEIGFRLGNNHMLLLLILVILKKKITEINRKCITWVLEGILS